jgi:phospholipase C
VPNATELARDRIEHVVILMLENRAFDHMFAFLEDAGLPPVEPGVSYPNRLDPGDPNSRWWGVTPDAGYALPLDPPHSHLGVMKQVNGIRRPRMDGFVAAYAQKAAGKEVLPIIHWDRLRILAVVFPLLVGFASWLAGVGGPSVPLSVGTLATVLGWWALHRWRPPGLHGRVWILLHTVPVIGALFFVGEALLLHSGWWLLGLLVLVAVALVGVWAVGRWERKPLYRPIDPSEDIEDVARRIMHCMPEHRIPVLSMLAREFALCTDWHCSVPGATWPNRNFAHAATSEGTTDIEFGLYESDTVFERLEEAGRTWGIYYDGMAQVLAFRKLWDSDGRAGRWFDMSAFAVHAAAGSLPNYTFIEPCHQGSSSNSQHPGNNRDPGHDGSYDFERGEQLIADVYEALRSNHDLFTKTVLVITYDEHGGLFDHVPPRTDAFAPTRREALVSWTRRFVAMFVTYRGTRFDFRTTGPRVPAVVVSPWIARGQLDPTSYDHSSIPATVRRLFAPNARPLTRRDRHAETFEHLVGAMEHARPPDDLPPAPPPPRLEAGADVMGQVGPHIEADVRPGPPEIPLKVEFDALAEKVRTRLHELGVRLPMSLDEAADHRTVDPYWDVTLLFHQHAGEERHRSE